MASVAGSNTVVEVSEVVGGVEGRLVGQPPTWGAVLIPQVLRQLGFLGTVAAARHGALDWGVNEWSARASVAAGVGCGDDG